MKICKDEYFNLLFVQYQHTFDLLGEIASIKKEYGRHGENDEMLLHFSSMVDVVKLNTRNKFDQISEDEETAGLETLEEYDSVLWEKCLRKTCLNSWEKQDMSNKTNNREGKVLRRWHLISFYSLILSHDALISDQRIVDSTITLLNFKSLEMQNEKILEKCMFRNALNALHLLRGMLSKHSLLDTKSRNDQATVVMKIRIHEINLELKKTSYNICFSRHDDWII